MPIPYPIFIFNPILNSISNHAHRHLGPLDDLPCHEVIDNRSMAGQSDAAGQAKKPHPRT